MGLSNEKYAQIRRVYEERQNRSRSVLQKRTRDLEEKQPRLKALRQQTASVSIARAMELLAGSEQAADDLHRQLGILHTQKAQLLEQMGYPADYLDPVYECPDCQDTGYIGNEKCHCMKQLCIDMLYEQSHIRAQLENDRFENFRLDYYDRSSAHPFYRCTSYDAARSALDACTRFAQHFRDARGNILLSGDVGTGKTFLTHCIAGAVLDQGFSVLYFSAGELMDQLGNIAFHREEADPEEYIQILECDLLIIDDLGTELSNSFTVQRLFTLLNERLIRNVSVVISTNLSMEEIEDRYSERTASRISSGYTILNMFGDDIRFKKRLLSLTKKAEGSTL